MRKVGRSKNSSGARAPGRLSLRNTLLYTLILAGVWEAAALSRPDLAAALPRVGSILERLAQMTANGSLPLGVFYSTAAVLTSFVLSFLTVAAMLYVSGFAPCLRGFADYLSAVFGSIPGVAILPIVILWFGLSRTSVLLILIHAMIWPVWIGVSAASDRLTRRYERLIASYRVGRLRAFVHLILQGAAPDFIAAARVAWSRGWRAVISIEMIFGLTGSGSGLGWLIYERRMYMDTAGVVATLIAIALCGLVFERVVLERLLGRL